MITGAHVIIYSTDAEADRAFFRDVLKLPNVDVGEGWLIFALPPSEVAIHPSDENDIHELYLMCDDVEELVDEMERLDVPCAEIEDTGWGLVTQIELPGGGSVSIYEPKHRRPN
ncbi:MAG: extradiol dioxygenase [Rhizomicrobium sp.]|jgi:catechol 2,3-dioxygenase-like lactoylglutathione lyase family enzyme